MNTNQMYKKIIFELFGNKCQYCGDGENTLCIHHKNFTREDNSLKNLSLLCLPCHSHIHRQIEKIEDFVLFNINYTLEEALTELLKYTRFLEGNSWYNLMGKLERMKLEKEIRLRNSRRVMK